MKVANQQNINSGHSTNKYSAHYTPTSIKLAAIAGSAVGVLGTAYLLSKGQTKKTGKFVDTFSVKYNPKEILALGAASVLGGTTAGIVADKKEHKTAKYKEGVYQLLANVISPITSIAIVDKLYSKVAPNIKLPQFKPKNEFNKTMNTVIKAVPNFAVVSAGLVGGIAAGTIIANKVISKIFNKKDKKEVSLAALGYHVDDIVTSASIADKTGFLQKSLGKFIPAIFTVMGYEAGTKRDYLS
jgi:hypothetical protein